MALYLDNYEKEHRGELGPWFGWVANQLPGYPNMSLMKCNVHPQDDRMRPLIELEPTDHPLAVQQREGITLDQILDFYAANGYNIRPSLEAN